MAWIKVGEPSTLTANSGVACLVGSRQVALYWIPALEPAYYALDNFDPLGQAYVLARGMVGDIQGEPCVASPLYKQHFSLRSGICLEQSAIRVAVWPVKLEDGGVWIADRPLCAASI